MKILCIISIKTDITTHFVDTLTHCTDFPFAISNIICFTTYFLPQKDGLSIPIFLPSKSAISLITNLFLISKYLYLLKYLQLIPLLLQFIYLDFPHVLGILYLLKLIFPIPLYARFLIIFLLLDVKFLVSNLADTFRNVLRDDSLLIMINHKLCAHVLLLIHSFYDLNQ